MLQLDSCIELQRAVLQLQENLSSKQACLRVTQSQHALQRSQDLGAIVMGQPLERSDMQLVHSVCPTSDSERATRTGQQHIFLS